VDTETLEIFRSITYEKSGIVLAPKDEALVQDRVSRRMQELGLASEREYAELLLNDKMGQETDHLVEAIAANVSRFFNDSDQFDFIAEAFAKWKANGQIRFRLWSAASSTGEEPYSLAMALAEKGAMLSGDTKILATDINAQALKVCKQGVYEQRHMAAVPPAFRYRYFDKVLNQGVATCKIKPEIRHLLTFRQLNLSSPPYPMHGPFDAILCRNVVNYFDQSVRQSLFDEAYRLLRPGGYLLMGDTENLDGLNTDFESVQQSIFVRPEKDVEERKKTLVTTSVGRRTGRRIGVLTRRSDERKPDRRVEERRHLPKIPSDVKNVYIHAGDVEVSSEPCVFSTVLGSCVSVCIYDKTAGWGGMNHFMHVGLNSENPLDTKWGLPAISMLIQKLQGLGSRPKDLTVQVIGGGKVVEGITMNIGHKNVEEAFSELKRWGVPIVATDTGGETHRRLRFHSHTGRVELL